MRLTLFDLTKRKIKRNTEKKKKGKGERETQIER